MVATRVAERATQPTVSELERFYATAMPIVHRYFLARCNGDRTVAEDLTQDTMLSAAREIRQGRFGDFPVPWVLGIARHRLLDHYARKRRDRRRLLAWGDGLRRREQVSRASEPYVERIHDALASLPAAQRTVVVLHHLDGLPVADVADLLGRSTSATESLLARGRASLRAALEEVTPDA